MNADTIVDLTVLGAFFGSACTRIVLSYPPRSNVVGLCGFESDSVDELVKGFSDGAI